MSKSNYSHRGFFPNPPPIEGKTTYQSLIDITNNELGDFTKLCHLMPHSHKSSIDSTPCHKIICFDNL